MFTQLIKIQWSWPDSLAYYDLLCYSPLSLSIKFLRYDGLGLYYSSLIATIWYVFTKVKCEESKMALKPFCLFVLSASYNNLHLGSNVARYSLLLDMGVSLRYWFVSAITSVKILKN